MLAELRIENLAVIGKAELAFSAGLNVITGETGAGKTILAHAISLLLGGRADSRLIRPGAAEAQVEAAFRVPASVISDLGEELDLGEGEDIIVRRRISRDGRSRAFLGGRAASVGTIAHITAHLMEFSAQHDQRRLMMSSRQLEILDEYAGAELAALKEEYVLMYARRGEVMALISGFCESSEADLREAELLRFQIEEIERAGARAGEDAGLESERQRLLRAADISATGLELWRLIAGSDDAPGLVDQISPNLAKLETLAEVDPALGAIRERLSSCVYELEDVARSARDHASSVESDPERLQEIEERLELISGLKRKYGGTLESVLEYVTKSSGKLAGLEGRERSLPAAEAELAALEEEMKGLAAKMRSIRAQAAQKLSEAAGRHLADLAFKNSGFEARLIPSGSKKEIVGDDLGREGADSVEFYIKLNPGMPAVPLRQTASGGELSRIMLAIKSAVVEGERGQACRKKVLPGDPGHEGAATSESTMVFDEIDAGIGGETGMAVGSKLGCLAARSQIICITHLPQIACWADRQFSVLKESCDDSTETSVFMVEGDQKVEELCRMMGASADEKARGHARGLLQKAAAASKKAAVSGKALA